MALRVSRQNIEVLTKGVGPLRITRQNVEVLTKGDGPLRVTRQNVEILVSIGFDRAYNEITIVQTARSSQRSLIASNTITIIDAANLASTYEVSASQSITITDTASWINNSVSASNTINILQAADPLFKQRDVSDPIIIVDIAAYTFGLPPRAAIDVLTISQTASFTGPRYVSASNTITIVQDGDVRGTIRLSASDSLIITEDVFDEDTVTWTTVSTGIEQSATRQTTFYREAHQHLTIQQVGFNYVSDPTKWIPKFAEHIITIIDNAVRTDPVTAIDSITIVSTASFDIIKGITDILTIVDVASLIKVLNIEASNVITIEQAHGYTLIRDNTLCTYSPFIGNSSSIDVLPPLATGPVIVEYDNVQLSYPLNSPTDTLTLRGPELGNQNNLNFQRINRETRGGTLTIYADPIWPKMETMILEFYGLSEINSQDALTFIATSLGKIIRIRDWEGQLWSGVIVSNNPIIRNGKGCSNSISMTIEVNKITLTWHTFVGLEYDAFIGDQWANFIGE